MPSYDLDLFVIGGGSAGVRLARMSASHGARVGLCEVGDLGGTCVNVGCVPKKLLSYGAHFAEDFRDAAGFGWTVEGIRFDWSTLIANKDKEIHRLNGIYASLLDRAGVELIRGRGRLVGPHEVEVDGRRITAAHIAICTGGWPSPLPIPGAEHCISSNEVFFLPELPKRVVIVGGGYIAAEFASIFHGLGSEVHVLYRGPLFLRGFDDDLRHEVANEMRKKGIHLHWSCVPTAVERSNGELTVQISDGQTLVADQVLMATGRHPNVEGLGLEALGIQQCDKGAIMVDDGFRTSVPSVLALGDVIARIQLTPVALGEAMVVTHNLFVGGTERQMDYRDIPTAIFTHPNAAAVGLTEAEARAKGEVRIFKSTFRSLKNTLSGNEERTLMKLVVDAATDRVLGCHMVGPDAGELIQGLAVAVKCGATKAQFDATVGIHPTAAEEFVTMRTEWHPPVP